MSWLIETALANAAVAILLAAVISLVGRRVRRPAVLHVLWVLVLVKLVTPPLLPINIPVPSTWAGTFGVHESTVSLALEAPTAPLSNLPHEERSSALTTVELSSASAVSSVVDTSKSLSSGGPPFGTAVESLPDDQPPPLEHEAAIATNVNEPAFRTWVPTLLLGVCAAGSLVWWGLCAYRIVWFKHRVLRVGRDDPSLGRRVAELARQFGLSRVPFIGVVDVGIAPMLWGCGRWTWIVLPQRLLERLDADARDAMLLHELAHFGRGDHWVRLLELLVTGLYWWHPVVWWTRRQIAICEEECCDARVVSLSRSPRRYAEVLLETLDFVADFRPVLSPVTSGMSDVPILERRLRQIMAGVTPWNLPRAGRWGLVGLAALLPCNPFLLAAVSHGSTATDRARPTDVIEPVSARVTDGATPFAELDQLLDESASVRPQAESGTVPSWPGPTDHPLLRTGPTRDDWGTAASGSERFRLAASWGGRVQLRDASTSRSVDLTETGITAAAFLPRERMLVGTKTGDV